MFDYDESKADVLTICEEQIKNILADAYDKGLKDGYDLAREQKPAEGKWIPCSERLPNKTWWYAVTLSDRPATYVRWYSTVNGWEEEENDVVAWMPLPEPYKEGADDEAL